VRSALPGKRRAPPARATPDNQNLDWLRTGLTDMLVTDLPQSPDIEVLGTDRLVQILGSMKKLDDKVISFNAIVPYPQFAIVSWLFAGRAHLMANLSRPDRGEEGDKAKARENHATFVRFWRDGDIDRDTVEEAGKKSN
jgi:hypothetical protein